MRHFVTNEKAIKVPKLYIAEEKQFKQNNLQPQTTDLK